MTTIEKLENEITELKSTIECHPPETKAIYLNGVNLRQLYSEELARVRSQLLFHPFSRITNRSNTICDSFSHAENSKNGTLIHLSFVADVAESMPEFQAAYKLIQPLVNKLAELEADLVAEVDLRGKKQSALNAAREAALERARLAAETDPSVLAAEADLAALERPPGKAKAKSGTADLG
jgi:hypothetical protein